MSLNRPEMYRFHNGGKKDALPFADQEYHDRLEGLRGLLPPEARESLQIVDYSNNKVYLAVAQL